MSGCVLSDIQARSKSEWLYVRYSTDTNVVKYSRYEHLYTFVFFKHGVNSRDFSQKYSSKISC